MAYSVTFCDAAENGVGMEQIGNKRNTGFTKEELLGAKAEFEAKGCICELVELHQDFDEVEEAYILIIRDGVKAFGVDKDDLINEQKTLEYDTKALMRGIVKNKRARHNICFSDYSQEPDYPAGKGRIINFKDVKFLNQIRKNLSSFIGANATNLQAEGNHYYDMKKCYIGYHGDAERRLVIAIRLGESHPLLFQWHHRGKKVGKKIRLNLDHGDMYIMSDKAVGTDWKRPSIYTLRHAAGCEKYLK
jgi:alkylated DNA repair dioxygenase AlkB